MDKEDIYVRRVGKEHIKKYGQYFTNKSIADFMASWLGNDLNSVLDPASGNGYFLQTVRENNPKCKLFGYEIDKEAYDFFNLSHLGVQNKDFLLSSWNDKYDGIICNPPYGRFQSIENRDDISNSVFLNTGIKYSLYTNLYILFLIKCLYQLSDNGKLAFIIPSEFLNSKYGEPIKAYLIEKKLLKAIINFNNDSNLFTDATTTCCILLVTKEEKDVASFYTVESIDDLKSIFSDEQLNLERKIPYSKLEPQKKWRALLQNEVESHLNSSRLCKVSEFCRVTRGIATGANDYFCFSKSKADAKKISFNYLTPCICRSADVKEIIFTDKELLKLIDGDKKVLLLDLEAEEAFDENISTYLQEGLDTEINKKYLVSKRSPWFTMERKQTAPIWVSSAYRDEIKFIRNTTNAKSLTTFHSIFMKNNYEKMTNVLFCYFLTPFAQQLLKQNRKELGNKLGKFQPNDLNNSMMLNLNLISTEDLSMIDSLYYDIISGIDQEMIIEQLNNIFLKYAK